MAISSSWLPVSTTFPSETTAIMSTFRMVLSRWAITIVVLLPVSSSLSSASCTTSSLSESSAEVASSRSSIFGFFTRTRAIAILCFWPPESWVPLSPTSVSYPSGNDVIKS
mmetsp:Transcript_34181/g.45724  ORF Transcript_34181/g.45724 Transcript_34181/m.45724 type:complete len:111 (+) Transcript_34181:2562-2894(+)